MSALRFPRVLQRTGRTHLVGHVDTVQDRQLHGWVWQPSAPEKRILVDIFVDGAFYGQQLAHRLRSDLLAQDIGDGRYGFEIDLGETSDSSRTIDVFALGDRQRARLTSKLPTRSVEDDPIVRTAQDYIRATFRSIHGWNAADENHAPVVRSQDALYERLFAPSPIPSDPVVLGTRLCGYLDLVRVRSDLRKFDPSLTPGQYRDFLSAYLVSYGKIRGRNRAPLSAADIAFLNASVADANRSSRAQAIWAVDHDLPPRDRAFLWAAFQAPALSVEDCLIPNSDIAMLSESTCDGPFPLSQFMIALHQQNPFLRALPRQTEEDRAFITFVFLLQASRHPHFLTFVHSRAIDALLSDEAGESRFDALWRSIFDDQAASGERWSRTIANSGFDIANRRYCSVALSGSRLAAPQIALRNQTLVDVQVFGPFSRALGIGQSARRMAAALRTLDYSIRLCDFSLDHPNEFIFPDADAYAHPGPARVNVFHMNLEDIPTLVAYSADVFSGSPRVAVPYLELTPVSASHYLGLNLIDEAWAATQFVADIISPHRQVFVIGASVEPIVKRGRRAARQAAYDGLVRQDDFVFLTAGDALSGVDRKNPLGVIRSFLHAFPSEPGVRLVVKTHSIEKVVSPFERGIWEAIREICAAEPRILLLDRLLPDTAHYALIEGADCLVSLHRSEGLGYHLLEAMHLGVPVIATAYSGPADFCSPETAFPCDYHLVHVEPHQYARATAGQVWADPDYAHATRQMLKVFHDRMARDQIVANARRVVDSDFSPQALGVRLETRLRGLCRP